MDESKAFGQWVKERRKELGLTQETLGALVGCVDTMIRRIEAGTRRPSGDLARSLAANLKIAPAEQPRFLAYAHKAERIAGAARLSEPNDPYHSRLPHQLTTFVGREAETARIQSLLEQSDVRLLTLTGPPGVGKTRLALQVAANLEDVFADGVRFVPLAALRDPDLVAGTIAQLLAVRLAGQPTGDLLDSYVRDKELLLVLDNFEQVSAAAPRIANLLLAAPRLKILVTSREVLRVYGEHEFSLAPLPLPGDGFSPDFLATVPAVALFVQRTQSVKPDFQLTRENAATVAAICRHLDGLPLALELAAARSKTFPPQAMLNRLAKRLTLLTGGPIDQDPRQQTLGNAIQWSYDLLNPDEQRLFRRVAVFVGGFALEAGESVCSVPSAAGGEVTDLLLDLVNKSLVQQETGRDDEPRFRMLGTIRDYAWEQLDGNGEKDTIQRQHANYYLQLVESAVEQIYEAGDNEAVVEDIQEELNQDHDNLQAIFDWALAGDEMDIAMRLTAGLWESGAGMIIGMKTNPGVR